MSNVVDLRGHQPGYFSLATLPQRGSVADIALGTGWWELDRIFKLYPGQFVVVTGLAGSGKSTLLLNIIANVAYTSGKRSFLYVPENEGHILEKLKLIWGDRAGKPGDRQGFKYFAEEQCYIQSAVPEMYDSEPQTLPWILGMAEEALARDHIDLLLIDPWNEVERARPKDMLMTDYIGQCLMWLKQFCRKHDITVIVVAHPTKQGVEKGKTPSLADIEGSMNWFNKCDNGLIVHRPDTGHTCQVISAKVRELGAGKRGVCHFFVDEVSGRFTPQQGGVYP